MEEKIDFVITWVDSSDKKWLKDINNYSDEKIDACRYRDWEILKYWFRAIEKHTPWVNKVYFITYGHIPHWLNIKNNKLKIVKHEDFIEKKYLPTFNSCVIESNFGNIKDLSEKFVYFNDDMFINDDMEPEEFFINDHPCDKLKLRLLWDDNRSGKRIHLNCMKKIYENFKNLDLSKYKKISIRDILKSIKELPNKATWCFIPDHTPTSFLKTTYKEAWNKNKDYFENMCYHRFRTAEDVSQWFFQFWQMALGECNERADISKYYEIKSETIDDIIKNVEGKEYKLICLNDSENTKDFEKNKEKLCEMFERMYPQKSNFEL